MSLASRDVLDDARPVQERVRQEAEGLLDAQRAYYELRAPDYANVSAPSDRASRGLMPREQVQLALDELTISGNVLELACGSGAFTAALAERAASLTALDASPRMLELNRERTTAGNVDYVCADVFTWDPDRIFDFVFFAFWLSHVPPTHFSEFWDRVRTCLGSGGRCGFVDEDDRAAGNEAEIVSTGEVPAAVRTLTDGRRFEIVKVFWTPQDLQQRLTNEGWAAQVRRIGDTYLLGQAIPGT